MALIKDIQKEVENIIQEQVPDFKLKKLSSKLAGKAVDYEAIVKIKGGELNIQVKIAKAVNDKAEQDDRTRAFISTQIASRVLNNLISELTNVL